MYHARLEGIGTDFLFFMVADERIAAVKMAADSAMSSTSLLEPSSAANSSLTILSNTYYKNEIEKFKIVQSQLLT